MKTILFVQVLAVACGSVRASDFSISARSLNKDQIIISWDNGRPTYQLQMRTSFSEPWMNVGPAVSGTNATAQLSGSQTFFRVLQDHTARYQVLFDATWSQATHPREFPSGSAHFSGLVGGVHNDQVHFWRAGELATEGIRLMAERGSQSLLLSEVGAAIANGTADFALSGGGVSPSPGTRLLVFTQPMRREFPLVTLCSMIAPTPDWFVGSQSLNLLENNRWVSNKVVTLFGYDAGTDSGPSFLSPDEPTVPRAPITRFADFPALVDGEIRPFGTFTFTRLD